MASLIVLLAPVLGCLRLFFMPERDDADKDRIRGTAILFTGISLLSALWMWMTYDTGVIWTGCYISRSITDRVKEHYILLLALVTGVFGVFLSLDLFFFYFFYEMAVIPMYLLIGVWGSRAQQYSKEYATMKLTLYLTAGAVVALVGLLAIYFLGARALWDQGLLAEGSYTFDIRLLIQAKIASGLQIAWFPVIFLGFGCIVPMWPLHSWSPIGHAAAPSAVSMLHAGVLMNTGWVGSRSSAA
jgi:NADH-quinone oxidoreductase subunit M